ncbi:hypothetical protein AVEN_255221-1 [Araneus ventricosus]|uniref:Uncharacterized protein n=1 Tax=Araneus ventricosus TaxID=182803 RepID=A0A4Y2BD85_ARAVE|nr:hypothetical protein AVEN_255221-1 [Araneus ventricosus]
MLKQTTPSSEDSKDPVKKSNASKPKKSMNSAKETNKSTETCAIIGQESLRTKEILFRKIQTEESSIQRSYRRTKILLTGIGEAQVTVIGSLDQEFHMDDENYLLTWHVVPTTKLKFEAVIGSDILEQVSVYFTENGVEFANYASQALLMQISAENLQEVDLSHVKNLQIKKKLKKMIENYKPKKTASTDVTMTNCLIIFQNNSQSPIRLAFPERQEVNKHIDEWMKEGIKRLRSSKYASSVVMVKKKDCTSRMCIDYRKLNQKLPKDEFPLPPIEADVLDTLQKKQRFILR